MNDTGKLTGRYERRVTDTNEVFLSELSLLLKGLSQDVSAIQKAVHGSTQARIKAQTALTIGLPNLIEFARQVQEVRSKFVKEVCIECDEE